AGTGTITVNLPGTYDYTVTNTDNGCTTISSQLVAQAASIPTITVSGTQTITCASPVVTLTGSATPSTCTPVWTGGVASGVNSYTATAASANIYTLTITDASTGCSTFTTVTVISNTTTPNLSVSNTVIPCGATSTDAIATSTDVVSYNWTTTTGSILSTNSGTATVGSAGAYSVTVTDLMNGCTNGAPVTVTENNITVAFTANPTSGTAPLDVNFTDQSIGATSYSWNFGDITSVNNTSSAINPSHTYTTLGVYTVTLTASNGSCTSTAMISIEVLENSTLIVPNVFTPNGDGSNDLFKITSTGIEELNCDIFNRWGTKLYSIKTVNDSWDGGGNSAGTYFFILTAKGYDGKEHKQEGFISLFK
ncbi:MAG: domain containing protein, partial [Bacteroidetes bacterium]|nr:domain containing protein [Bacteroidota bacterium]